MLTVTVEKQDGAVVLHCAGRLVHGYDTALLCAASHQEGQPVTVDLENVTAIDAAGIGALISLQAAGIYLRLLNPSAPVIETLRVTQVDSIFEIYGSPTSRVPAQAIA
jgi:anti-anti-sigma factor